MAGNKINKLTIRKNIYSQKDMAVAYYRIISALENLALSEMEILILAHTALHGTITSPPVRESFLKEYGYKKASLNNYISKLREKGLLVKDERLKIRVLPKIMKTFDKDEYIFNINFEVNEPAGKDD